MPVPVSSPSSFWITDFRDVNAFARDTPWLHLPFQLYAGYGVVVFALLLLGGWWTARRRRDLRTLAAAVWAPMAVLLAVAVNQPIVGALHEARPYDVLPGVLVLASRTTDPSFPSDHATMAGAAAAALLLVERRLGVSAAIAAAVMAFARVYIAAHFPQDVLAGLALGTSVALVGYLLVRRPLTILLRRAADSRLRPLLVAAPPVPARPAA